MTDLSQYSNEDLMGMLQQHAATPGAAPDPSASPGIQGVQKATDALANVSQKPGFWEGAKRGFTQRGIGMGQLLNDVGVGDKMGLPPNQDYDKYNQQLDKEGKGTGVMGTLGEAAGDPLNYAAGPLAPEMKGLSFAARLGKGALSGAEMGAGYGATAPSSDDQGLGDRASNTAKGAAVGAMAFPAASEAAGLVGKGAGYVANKFKSAPEGFNPIAANQSISQNYYDKMQEQDALYDQMRFHANDENGNPRTIVANGLQNFLNNSISQLSDTVSPSEQKAARTLKMIRDRRVGTAPEGYDVYPETGRQYVATPDQLANTPRDAPFHVQPLDNISYQDLVDLKQALNEGFKPSQFATKGDRALGSLSSKVNEGLEQAGAQTPEFGQALTDANSFHANEIQNVFRNDTLGKFWTPDDYYSALQGRHPMDDVDAMSRIRPMIDNIKTPEHLQAVAQALPEDQRQPLIDAVWDKIKSDAAMPKERAMKMMGAVLDASRMNLTGAAKNTWKAITAKPDLDALGEIAQKNATQPSAGSVLSGPAGLAATRGEADTQQDPLRMDLHPRAGYYDQAQASGGEVYSPDKWLTMVRKHGKKANITAKDRLDPASVKRLHAIVAEEKPRRNKYSR